MVRMKKALAALRGNAARSLFSRLLSVSWLNFLSARERLRTQAFVVPCNADRCRYLQSTNRRCFSQIQEGRRGTGRRASLRCLSFFYFHFDFQLGVSLQRSDATNCLLLRSQLRNRWSSPKGRRNGRRSWSTRRPGRWARRCRQEVGTVDISRYSLCCKPSTLAIEGAHE